MYLNDFERQVICKNKQVVLMMNYYWVSINSRVSTVAYAPKGTPSSHELITEIEDNSALPFSLQLHEVCIKDKLEKGELSVIIEGSTTSKMYYIPMFTSELDTLNIAKSIFVPSSGVVLKPCFKKDEVEKYAVFHGYSKFWKITTQIYVNEDIKKGLMDSKLKELSFSRITIK